MYSYKELTDIFIELTFLIRGFDYSDQESANHKLVRKAYQEESEPFGTIAQDVCYMNVTYADDPINRPMLVQYNAKDITDSVVSGLSVLRAEWVYYGRNAQQLAKIHKLKLYDPAIGLWLRKKEIALVTDVVDPATLFERYERRFWQRSDIFALFNTREWTPIDLPYIEVADIDVNTESGEHVIIEITK
jgi:hypothetical protein